MTKSPRRKNAETKRMTIKETNVFETLIKKFVFFDIDGVLSNNDWRWYQLRDKKIDWKKYVSMSTMDNPIVPNVQICYWFLNSNLYSVKFLTGRKEWERLDTLKWLRDNVSNKISSDMLFMKPNAIEAMNKIVDAKLKIQWGKQITNGKLDSILCVFEDRDFIVKEWRKAGVYCIQPQAGPF
jgi:hypothetical protein